MKLVKNHPVAGEMTSSGEGTVVVGVKLDSQSRELLTWAMVKVAKPGDRVIALHVLNPNEVVDRDGKSSLLSLVKAFDSILAVYEGFCNLKQVDLKLKICRGTSIRRIIVREAKEYNSTKVIVGTSTHHHKIRSSTSVAQYLAKKLSNDCWILAVNNGKVLFQREAVVDTVTKSREDHRQNGLLKVIYRSMSKSSKIAIEGSNEMAAKDRSARQKMELAFISAVLGTNLRKEKCSMCEPASVLQDDTCRKTGDESAVKDSVGNSLAIVPVKTLGAISSSISLTCKGLPELRPGWPLLSRSLLLNQEAAEKPSIKKASVVQWAMQLPKRTYISFAELDHVDNHIGAIVRTGHDVLYSPPTPDHSLKVLPKELEGLHVKYLSTCRLFQYHELASATSNFKPDNLIGKGGSSRVYKGSLPDGKELAVKILKPSEYALKEFLLEIEISTTLNHKNIISLLGFCFEDNNLLLVYDFLSRGSLEENLNGDKKGNLVFGWNERYKVAVGIAEALDYLHCISPQPVIHRDVKSSNILLSDDFEPQLSDFGLAKWASTSSPYITCTDVAGTFGYLAPEYFMYGKVNHKIDVYAFGVVLLELLSGRKPISSDYPKGQESLVMWAKLILGSGKFSHLLDSSLGDNYDCDQTERMVLAATLCIQRAPQARPTMKIILKLLQGDWDMIKWARQQVNVAELLEEETCPRSDLKSHLNVALLDVEDDSLSLSTSTEQSISVEDYLQADQ